MGKGAQQPQRATAQNPPHSYPPPPPQPPRGPAQTGIRNNPPQPPTVRQKPFIDLELDGYSTASSPDDYSDGLSGGEDAEGIQMDGEHPLLFINITDVYSGANFPDIDYEIEDTEDPFVKTELVIKFNPKINHKALKWFIGKVLDKKSSGGAELLLSREPYYGMKNEGLTFHITANCWRQLEVAEHLEIKKLDYTYDPPVPREFKIREINRFLRPNMENHQILTPAEKQLVILHELKHLHSMAGERSVPGYNDHTLRPGQSLLHLFTSTKLITSYFPLHDVEALDTLDGKWFKEFWDEWPYEEIRAYFGERTCLYFNFVAFNSIMFLIPGILGLIVYCFPAKYKTNMGVYFSFVNMIIVTVFLILWHRHQSDITFKWGTLRMNVWEEPRVGYFGSLGRDPVTGKIQYTFPYSTTFIRTYFISLPVVLVCSFLSLLVMAEYIDVEDYVKARVKVAYPPDTQIGFWGRAVPMLINLLPSVTYCVAIYVADLYYRDLAKYLTEWENHRTEHQFEKHLVLKMITFEFVNNYCLFFYTAFYLRDIDLLSFRLVVFLTLTQGFVMAQEIFISQGQSQLNTLRRHGKRLFRHHSSESSIHHQRSYPHLGTHDVEVLSPDDPRVEMSKAEEKMRPYNDETDFDDYLFLFLQFGYVFLFSSVCPIAAFIAFLCNNALLYLNLYKRRAIFQRTIVNRVSNIGAWGNAYELIAIFAVMTNCALIGINDSLRQSAPTLSDTQWLILFVVLEHIFIAIHYCLKTMISKVPSKVRLTLAALKYQSWEALKREQARSTRRRLTRIFRPIQESVILHERGAKENNGNKPQSTGQNAGASQSPQNNLGGQVRNRRNT